MLPTRLRTQKPLVSLVMPCFNEAEVLPMTYGRLIEAANHWDVAIEIILVDDGSQDETWTTIDRLARRDPRVRGVRLSRNFGHQAALGAGLSAARGEAIVTLDADLQDPPELIASMIDKWQDGFDVVYAQRNRREGETLAKRAACALFYRLLDRVNQVPIPRDTGDFALLDARVARTLLRFREHALFWRGLRCWSGFRHTAVHFDRPGRAGGRTKYTLSKLFGLASDGLLSFSTLPLRLALFLGLGFLGLTLLAVMIAALWSMVHAGPTAWPISGSVLTTLVLGSTQLICLGIMGEYLNRIYDEVRDRPRWIVEQTTPAASPQWNAADEQPPARMAG